MVTQKLDKNAWSAFCNRLSQSLVGKRVEVEVASLRLGDQIAAEWLPLLGIVYDHKDDMIEIALENLDHLIRDPSGLYVELDENGVSSLAVTDGEGTRHIVKLREPVLLPAAAG